MATVHPVGRLDRLVTAARGEVGSAPALAARAMIAPHARPSTCGNRATGARVRTTSVGCACRSMSSQRSVTESLPTGSMRHAAASRLRRRARIDRRVRRRRRRSLGIMMWLPWGLDPADTGTRSLGQCEAAAADQSARSTPTAAEDWATL
jgi:hypothetical protein